MKTIKDNWFIAVCLFIVIIVVTYVGILNYYPSTLDKQNYSVEGTITDIYSQRVIIPAGKVMIPRTQYYLRVSYISPKTGDSMILDEKIDIDVINNYHVGEKIGLSVVE